MSAAWYCGNWNVSHPCLLQGHSSMTLDPFIEWPFYEWLLTNSYPYYDVCHNIVWKSLNCAVCYDTMLVYCTVRRYTLVYAGLGLLVWIVLYFTESLLYWNCTGWSLTMFLAQNDTTSTTSTTLRYLRDMDQAYKFWAQLVSYGLCEHEVLHFLKNNGTLTHNPTHIRWE